MDQNNYAKSGGGTSHFSSHSTRYAATSSALRMGISIDTIRKTAGWTENSANFAQYYNKPIIHEVYMQEVLPWVNLLVYKLI